MRTQGCGLLLTALMMLGSLAIGAEVAQPQQQQQQQQQPQAGKPSITILGIARPGAETAATVPSASLGDLLLLRADKSLLPAYLDYASEQKKQVTLFLNGNDTGLVPKSVDRNAGTLQFRLERNASDSQNKRIWSELLRNPFLTDDPSVGASIGIAGGVAEPSGWKFQLVVVKRSWAWWWGVILVGVLIAFFSLAARKDLLRDGPEPAPFSLGRCQMAWWFLLVLIGYVFIWLISGDRDAITESLLVLMGISTGTGLGAVLINSNSSSSDLNQAASEQLALEAALQNAQKKVDAANAAVQASPADAVARKEMLDATAELNALQAKLDLARRLLNSAAVAPKSRGFVRDLLEDGQGSVGLHRFQIAVWTFVLGIIFISSVLIELSMPTFSPTLLTLMGISAGTYLGFKFPEK